MSSPAEAPSPAETPRRAGWRSLCIFLGITFSAATVGGAVTGPSILTWYASLAKPWFTPPDWVFGPVWTTLFTMMAVAAWRVWREAGWPAARPAIILYGVQLALNVLWSALFFGLHRPDWALAEVVVFAGFIAATMVVFWRVDRIAGLLFVPYLAWASFATVLNYVIVGMNPPG